ncbi:hypothetical protein INR49_031334 [Caranx melampygus]|nr:hypothetical protein INR49_031334 [Caranx melampygus]
MLDPHMSESRGSQIMSMTPDLSQDCKGFLITGATPGYAHAMQKKNTVKELLKMKRQVYEQVFQHGPGYDETSPRQVTEKWKCTQEESDTQPECQSAKLEPFATDVIPHMSDPCAPANPYTPTRFLPAPPESGHGTPQRATPPAPQGPAAPTCDANMSLFHWQIKQEAQRLEGVCPELLNMQDADGDTFLHIAVAQGRRALVYVLAAKMAACGSVDVKEHNRQTALHIAAATNQHLIVQDLLAHGAQINTRDLWGRSPLHVCAEKGHYLSLQHCCPSGGLTPLHAAVLSHNAAVKEERCLENPCSYMAAELGQRRQMFVECIKTLLLMGASYGAKDLKSGRTCLHIASEEANVELLRLFLDLPSMLSIVNVKVGNFVNVTNETGLCMCVHKGCCSSSFILILQTHIACDVCF